VNYYIGVDGGGTKTEFSLFNEEKQIVATVKTPGSNHENYERAYDEASEIIWEGLNTLAAQGNINLDDVKFTLMGLAGIDHKFQYDIMCEN
jgi:N-acetylglucosamine kinase-like BadF-type ATPase